jgi:MFS transporter, ACS family, tartrate transporter
MSSKPEAGDVRLRARRRIALRLLPFVFVLYVVAYLDRVNVSFASLRMNADLGFSDSAFGLGSGIFYIGYVLFEIPGAIIVERWSARKWIGRIMVSWGLVTILTGFIHTIGQFYVARFALGLAEASFFPGIIVYLTRWFCLADRSRAIASLYAANAAATVIGAPLAGWLLGIHSHSLAGWRWLFIVEGIPAIVLGTFTFFYMTDRPAEAGWLPREERDWLVSELSAELEAKQKMKEYTITEAFCDRRILVLIAAYFLALSGALGNIYWIPAFVKRLSGYSVQSVTSLLLIPGLIGFIGILVNGWHSDRVRERRLHAAIPLLAAGLMYGAAILARQHVGFAICFLILGSGFLYAYYPVFWSMPTMMLSKTAAAATFGLMNSIGQLGGLFGPWLIGVLNDRTHSLAASLAFIAFAYVVAGTLILGVKIQEPGAVREAGRGRKT